MKKFPKNILIMVFLLILPLVVSSQQSIENVFYLTLNPSTPAPEQTFSASVTSSSFNVSNSSVRWVIDDSLEASGTGKSFISLMAPRVGGSMTIDVSITTPDGQTLSKRALVRPVGVKLFWEADTYTPPFYEGKSLYTYRSPIKVMAVPQTSSSQKISFLSRDDLNYRWSLNRKEIPGLSGFGKNVFEFIPEEVTSEAILIGVKILDSGGNLIASNSIFISERSPKIIFYEQNPLLGEILDRAITENYVLNKDEVSVKAEPYYFTRPDLENNKLVFVWKLNNKEFNVTGDHAIVTFGKGEGSSLIELVIENPMRIIQKAIKRFVITNE